MIYSIEIVKCYNTIIEKWILTLKNNKFLLILIFNQIRNKGIDINRTTFLQIRLWILSVCVCVSLCMCMCVYVYGSCVCQGHYTYTCTCDANSLFPVSSNIGLHLTFWIRGLSTPTTLIGLKMCRPCLYVVPVELYFSLHPFCTYCTI